MILRIFAAAMKRVTIYIFLFSVLLLGNSCDKERGCIKGEGASREIEFTLAQFRTLNLGLVADVFIEQDTSAEFSHIQVVAQSNILDKIEVEHYHDFVGFKFNECIKRHSDIRIFITVADLNQIIIDGAGDVRTKELFITDQLEVNINGPGDVNLLLDAREIITRINAEGNVNLAGAVDHHRIFVSASGDINAFDFISDTTSIQIESSGFSRVYADSLLQIVTLDRGNVHYRGFPELKIVGEGTSTVTEVNL